jgi:hypothetical protein
MRQATHRTEHTGNAVLDRIQANVRDAVVRVRDLVVDLMYVGLGSVDVAMGDRDYQLTAAEAANLHIALVDTHSAVHVLKIPNAPRKGKSFIRWISNTTAGGQAVTVSSPAGGSVTVANATTVAVLVKHDTVASLV